MFLWRTDRSETPAAGHLRMAERAGGAVATLAVLEEHRYDALGRRVLLRARQEAAGHCYSMGTCYNAVVRTIWDGDQILWEIAAPGGSQSMDLEDDDYRQAFGGPYFNGRVQYTHAGGIDMPVILTRIAYSDSLHLPITIWPLTNWAGRFDSGEVLNGCVTVTIPGASGGTFAPYVPAPGEPGYDDDYHVIQHCVDPNWPGKQLWSSLRPKPGSPPRGWVGSLTQHGRDPSGQYYRRNRYYDPVAGRFTQEDPIGIAGGVNLYGYAGGDPVNYWDPFGLDETYVNCRPVGGEGDSGIAGHCAVRVVDADRGIDVTIELIPDGEGKNQIHWSSADSDLAAAYSGTWELVQAPDGMTTRQFADAVLRQGFIEARSIQGSPYVPLGEVNSNNFVFRVITGAGGQVPCAASAGFLFAPGICGGSGLSRGRNCSR